MVLMCGMLFFGAVYGYLYYNLNKEILNVDEKDYEVPYKHIPENKGIGFLLPDGSAVLVYLNFEKGCINVVDVETYDSNNNLYFGYTMDYTVVVDRELIGGMVDRVGGVNLRVEEETLRYTGVQVAELIGKTTDKTVKSQIISEIFRGISKNGLTKENFIYILQNSETNLTVLDCIDWYDYIDEIFRKIEKITNEEYYVQMAIAWLISFAYIKQKEKTEKYLLNNNLDKFTLNKSI